jgi:ribosomal protein S18 acetylase RimI-like enzyme
LVLQDLIQTAFRAPDTREKWTGDATKFLNDTFSIPIEAVENAITKNDSIFVIAYRSAKPAQDERAFVKDAEVKVGQKHKNDETIVACFNLVKKSSVVASISWFTIHPESQQSGLGRQLLSYAESHAKQTWPAVQSMELNALSSRDALIAWYERRGYVKTGQCDAFPVDKLPEKYKETVQDVGFVYLAKSLA